MKFRKVSTEDLVLIASLDRCKWIDEAGISAIAFD